MKRWIVAGLVLAGVWSCSQNVERVDSDERLGDAAAPAGRLEGPLTVSATEAAMSASEVPPFAKAYFMHTWVEALYSPPANNNPNPDWVSPLRDPVNGRVWCTDCHVSGQVNFENIPKQRHPMVDVLENDHEFMADLMRHWVERLNSGEYFAAAKLRAPVTCLTCHATHPDPD